MERVISIQRARNKAKKYTAHTSLGRNISFGARGYPQFRDSTPSALYRHKDHRDRARRRSYFMRHSGVPTKTQALRKEKAKSGGRLNAKILSHRYLW